MRKTKIVCTLGPACQETDVLEKMLIAGMNVARLNFSHGKHDSHEKMIANFRAVRDRLGLPAAVLLDTKGPEIRLFTFKEGKAQLSAGAAFTLDCSPLPGDESRCGISYADLPGQLKPGDRLLIDDGRVELAVRYSGDAKIDCEVVRGGVLSDRKGINVPKVHLDMPYLSDQDKADLLFGIAQDVDFIAASFVRTAQDVITLRRFLDYNGGHDIQIISKIENMEGVDNFDAILKHSNGIMVARGDMGVEVEFERLPGLQKKFIRRCYQAGKMVITATQMLESMVHNPYPTRAEITDVANAVFDGTSAVMLSGESAMGSFPVRAVQVMARIAEQAEADAFAMDVYRSIPYDLDSDVTNAICDAACTTARDINAKAIIAVSQNGYTARRVSKFRPVEPIIAPTPMRKAFHQLSLSWGVHPVLARHQSTSDELFQHAIDCAKQTEIVSPGDFVVMTAGIPLAMSGTTNVLKVQQVHGDIA